MIYRVPWVRAEMLVQRVRAVADLVAILVCNPLCGNKSLRCSSRAACHCVHAQDTLPHSRTDCCSSR